MSITKKFAILSAAVLCLQALPVFSASASSSLSAEQAARAEAYAYLADFGADEDILAAAVNSSGMDIHDYIAVYYSKSNAVNKDIRFESRTFYSTAIKPYEYYSEELNKFTSVIPLKNSSYAFEATTAVTGGHTFDYTCNLSAESTNEKLFYVLFEQNTSSASVTSVYPHASSSLWVKGANGKYTGQDWTSYVDCDIIGLGDVNLDGRISIQDSIAATQISNGTYTFTNERKQIAAADVNGDNEVNQNDIDDINRYLAHMISCFYWTAEDYTRTVDWRS